MKRPFPGGIRLRITLITVAITAIAMAVILGLATMAMRGILEDAIGTSMAERLDKAEIAVKAGNYQEATDTSGLDLLQVLDKDGNVIASSKNAAGLKALDRDKRDRYEADDLEFEEDEDEAEEPAPVYESAPAPVGPSTPEPAYSGDTWDDDGSDDWDSDWDSDDGYTYSQPDYDYDDYDYDYDNDYDYDDADYDYDDDDDVHESAFRGVIRLAHLSPYLANATTSGSSAARENSSSGSGAASESSSAAGAGEGNTTTIEASDVLDTPGPFLVMKREVTSPDGQVQLIAMTSLSPALESATRTAYTLGFMLAVLLALVGVFTWFMTGKTLSPVEQMRREVELISADNLEKRITPPAQDRELSLLASTFNHMLARVELSVQQQKRFVSDASHELKSPIAAIGLILESLRSDPEGIREQTVIDDLSAENARLEGIVGNLLMLARKDEGRLAVNIEPLDYCDLLFEEVASLSLRTHIPVDASRVQPVIGEADARLLSHAIRNLLDNAARYARSRIAVSCVQQGAWVRILISDDGPGIPPEDRERVFGRFVRLAQGRSSSDGGTGLGLPVTREIINQHGGQVFFGEPELGGATAVVDLPLAPQAAAAGTLAPV